MKTLLAYTPPQKYRRLRKRKDETQIEYVYRKILLTRQCFPPHDCLARIIECWIDAHDFLEDTIGALKPEGAHDVEIKKTLLCDDPAGHNREIPYEWPSLNSGLYFFKFTPGYTPGKKLGDPPIRLRRARRARS